ncbi:MAG: SusC/RagA family TonB-linked outer membrane protein, partial [Ginsengibacter sp.]
MKFILFFIFATCLEVGATGYSQTVTLSKNDATLKSIFKEIEKQSGYNFFYKEKVLKQTKDISIHVRNVSLEEALDLCFRNQPLAYTILDRMIVVKEKKTANVGVVTSQIIEANLAIPISGIVKDQAGHPLEGVSVLIKGTTRGTSTNASCHFSIDANQGEVLEFSIVGYQKRSITLGASTNLNVILEIEATLGNEVVVVGYGTQKRENVTGAISTIQAKDIVTTTSASLSQNLQGKIPGLQIRHQNGEPGSFSSSINIRGFGDPLYVIDGIVRDGRIEFNQLNPNDIESITVLKDASAAIYGLNAANGVILVTTKKGVAGKPVFNYSGVLGVQQPTNIPKMATAAQYLEMYDNAIFFRNGTHSIAKEELDKWKAGGPGYESTNWYAETFKKNALQQQHDFSVRGGSDNVKYFVSLGHFNEGGLFKSNDINYERYNFRSNLSLKLTNDLTADIMLSGRHSEREYPGGDGFIWIYKGSVVSHPNERPYINDNPEYPANIYIQQNPVLMSQKKYAGYTRNEDKNFRSSAVLTYQAPFLKGLEARGTAAYDSYNYFHKSVWKNYKVYNQDLTSQVINPPRISNAIDDANRMVFQGQLSFKRSFGNGHNFDVTTVAEQNRYNKKYSYLKRDYEFFTTDIVDYASGTQINQGREEEEATVSYIGRLNYDYQGKYMASYSFRYDGSYRYAPGKRWAFFPTASAGWRISEEGFFKNALPFVDDMKLRASYGSIGENVGAPFQHVLGFSPSTNQGAEFENGSFVGGLVAPGVINSKFTWVKSTILDYGVELKLWNGLLSLEADYYERAKTGKLKARVDGLPNTFGGDMPIENLENELTKGFDMIVSHRNSINKFQ